MKLDNLIDYFLLISINIYWRIAFIIVFAYSWFLSFKDIKYNGISQKMITPIYIMSIALFFTGLYAYHENYADTLFKLNYLGIISNQLISVLAAAFVLGLAHIQYKKRYRKLSNIEIGYTFAISIGIPANVFVPISIITLFTLIAFNAITNHTIRNRISQYIIFPITFSTTLSLITAFLIVQKIIE